MHIIYVDIIMLKSIILTITDDSDGQNRTALFNF